MNFALAVEPDWSSKAIIPLGETRENIYQLSPIEFKETVRRGNLHALNYPVTVTGLLIPYQPIITMLESDPSNPLKKLIYKLGKKTFDMHSMEDMYKWLGLTPYPFKNDQWGVPYLTSRRPDYYMGATIMNTKLGKGLTFSCAGCHAQSLFGRAVMGLTNKRPRANEFFIMGKKYSKLANSHVFKAATGSTEGERLLLKKLQRNVKAVGAKSPSVLGLDTSLPQVALSLARRNMDAYATKSRFYEKFPRKNKLETLISESKPMPWWNLKYKTRWLADGSIVQGNPVFTNFLWNELGRGTDLKELEQWMKDNEQAIKDLTAAAFASKAPHWTEFFGDNSIDITSAKRGEKLFVTTCKKCHGEYIKNWSLPNNNLMAPKDLVKTAKVNYHERTPVKKVGTDPNRYMGTQYFSEALNNLSISKWMETIVIPQSGYVPPPLEGIWSRYPYFHNNSVPSLCALLTPVAQRPKTFYIGPADNINTDFDRDCIGYPVGDKIPAKWKKEKDAFYDTSRIGMKNIGHSKMLFDANGNEKWTHFDKRDLIEFLKTL